MQIVCFISNNHFFSITVVTFPGINRHERRSEEPNDRIGFDGSIHFTQFPLYVTPVNYYL